MIPHLDTLDDIAAGRLTVAQAAATSGLSEADVTRQLEMVGLARALAQREVRTAKRQLGRRMVALAAVVAVTSTVWVNRTAWAQTVCAQTLPAPLKTFCPNDPALASQINGNFQQVVSWVEAKTGPIASANVTAGSLTATSLTANQKIRGKAQVATQGFELDWNRSGVVGETDFVNFPDQGTGGFRFYNGGTQVASISSVGDLAVTSVNGRRPAYVSANACSGANSSCTANCSPGVVKQGWGFHGGNGTNSNISINPWSCGNAYTWMGSCIGQTSCTISTLCPTSSIWVECW
jgi:hypothetical protein